MESLERSITMSVRSDSLRDLVLDAGEVAIDSLLNDGIAKDIPVFGSLFKICHGVQSIREAIFVRKIYKFLKEIGSMPEHERLGVLDEIIDRKGGQTAAGVAVLELVDKLDSEFKPELAGKLFRACGAGLITVSDFLRLSDVISKVYIDDLLLLKIPHPSREGSTQQKNIFLSVGLMSISVANPRKSNALGVSVGDLAKDIYDTKFKLDYKLTKDAALLSMHCFGIDRTVGTGRTEFEYAM